MFLWVFMGIYRRLGVSVSLWVFILNPWWVFTGVMVYLAVYGFLAVYEFLAVCGCIWMMCFYGCLWVYIGI